MNVNNIDISHTTDPTFIPKYVSRETQCDDRLRNIDLFINTSDPSHYQAGGIMEMIKPAC